MRSTRPTHLFLDIIIPTLFDEEYKITKLLRHFRFSQQWRFKPRCFRLLHLALLRWASGWTIGVLGFDSFRGLGIFFFTTESRTAPIQWIPGVLSLEVKLPGHEADHSPPSSIMHVAIPPLPNTPSWHGSQLKKSTGTTSIHLLPDGRSKDYISSVWKNIRLITK